MATPFDVIQEEVEAFNARDLERFLRTFAPNIVVEGLASAHGTIVGLDALREEYGRRMAQPGIRAEILSRIGLGPWVIDYELVINDDAGAVPQLAIYELSGEQIAHIKILRPELPDG